MKLDAEYIISVLETIIFIWIFRRYRDSAMSVVLPDAEQVVSWMPCFLAGEVLVPQLHEAAVVDHLHSLAVAVLKPILTLQITS